LGLVGCDIGDKSKLVILQRAGECIPPVKVELYIENTNGKPFWRVEIPSGKHKPYCTKQGIYKIRGDGKNNPLFPEDLLAIYLQEQGRKFNESFKRATTELNTILDNLRDQVGTDLVDLHNVIEVLRVKIEIKMGDITSDFEHSIRDANEKIAGAIGNIHQDITESIEGYTKEAGETVFDKVHSVGDEVKKIQNTLKFFGVAIEALLAKNGLENSETLYWRPWVHAWIDRTRITNEMLKADGSPLLSDASTFEMLSHCYSGLNRQLLLSLFREKVPGFEPSESRADE
jgi:hypothetical protein